MLIQQLVDHITQMVLSPHGKGLQIVLRLELNISLRMAIQSQNIEPRSKTLRTQHINRLIKLFRASTIHLTVMSQAH
jgi:hypothetical protein